MRKAEADTMGLVGQGIVTGLAHLRGLIDGLHEQKGVTYWDRST